MCVTSVENAETLLRKYGPMKTTVADIARLSDTSPAKGAAWHKIEMIVWKYHRAIRRDLENEPHILELVALVQRELALAYRLHQAEVPGVAHGSLRWLADNLNRADFAQIDFVQTGG